MGRFIETRCSSSSKVKVTDQVDGHRAKMLLKCWCNLRVGALYSCLLLWFNL